MMIKLLRDLKWFSEDILYKFLGLFSSVLKFRVYTYIRLKRIKSINRKIINANPEIKTVKDFSASFSQDSDTVFLLGSGDSVNTYDDSKWEIIRKKFSIGFNYWVINDFIPNLYFIEVPTEISHWDVLEKNMILKKNLYKNVPVIFKDLINKRFLRWKIYKNIDKISNNVYLWEDIPYPVSSMDEFYKDFSYIKRKESFLDKNYPIFHKTGSIFFLLNFAVKFGFKKIVLCGVDLNHNNYFFHTNKEYYQSKEIPLPPIFDNDKVHPTLNPVWSGEMTIDKILYIFNDEILKPSGIELFVALKSSALYPEIPSYFND